MPCAVGYDHRRSAAVCRTANLASTMEEVKSQPKMTKLETGSAVAAAANICAATVGTETDGSVVCPSGNNLSVGLKPIAGLVSQDEIIPITHSQDTTGSMCRRVTDVGIMLG
ncbi:MAG: hypothetical protein DME38_02235 [Verrucomicrobia bacterium]|nr:MAG: hypothetical protein DME38_02235 [Verrucomicrobiota bacterium]